MASKSKIELNATVVVKYMKTYFLKHNEFPKIENRTIKFEKKFIINQAKVTVQELAAIKILLLNEK